MSDESRNPSEHPDGWRVGDRVEAAGTAARRGERSNYTWATGHIVGFGIQNINIVSREIAGCVTASGTS